MTGQPEPTAGDALFPGLPAPQRTALQALRDAIRQLVPDATELMNSGVLTIVHYGPLVGIGPNKARCSLYVMRPQLVASVRAAIAPREVSGGTIHFAPDDPPPFEILERLIRARVIENEAAYLRRTRR